MLRGVFLLVAITTVIAIFGITAALSLGPQQTTDVFLGVVLSRTGAVRGHRRFDLLRMDIVRNLVVRSATPFSDPDQVILAPGGEYLFAQHREFEHERRVTYLEVAHIDQGQPLLLDKGPSDRSTSLTHWAGLPLSPDNTQVAYVSAADGTAYIHNLETQVTRSIGTVERENAKFGTESIYRLRWSPDGRHVLLMRNDNQMDIIPVNGGWGISILLPFSGFPASMDWSADGNHLLIGESLTSDEPGEITIVNIKTAVVAVLPDRKGYEPCWGHDNHTLFYIDEASHFRRLDLLTGATDSTDDLPLLADTEMAGTGRINDGKYFLLRTYNPAASETIGKLIILSQDFREVHLMHELTYYGGPTPDDTILEIKIQVSDNSSVLTSYDLTKGTLTALDDPVKNGTYRLYHSPATHVALYYRANRSHFEGVERVDLDSGRRDLFITDDEYLYGHYVDTG